MKNKLSRKGIKELKIDLISPKGYKRFRNPYIRYAGGKSLGVGYILDIMPEEVEKVISPFFGGGSVELALSQVCGIPTEGFDIFEPLVLFWSFLINDKITFLNKCRELKADKETYEKIRLIVNKEEYNNLPDLEKAVYFYYNHNLSYGPGFPGWPSSVYLKQDKWNSKLNELEDLELKNLSVKRKSFEDVIPEYSDDFLYLDPPYHLSGDMFRGIYPSRNRPFNHRGFNHELLNELLKSYKGKWILSYNNCEAVNKLYEGFNFYFPSWHYSMGQGETRIGLNRERNNTGHIKKSHEVLITNF